MSHNQYLEDLGLKEYTGHWSGVYRFPYNVFHFPKTIPSRCRRWWQRRKYGFDDRKTWNLETTLVEEAYSYLKMYVEKGGKIVDLTCHEFEFEGKVYTELEAIERILEAFKNYLLAIDRYLDRDEEILEETKKAFALIGVILPSLWW